MMKTVSKGRERNWELVNFFIYLTIDMLPEKKRRQARIEK